MNAISAYPLHWPAGWPRAKSRKRAKFGIGERVYSQNGGSWISKKNLTIAEATKRVLTELRALGVRDGSAIVSANLELRNDGLPRSGQREPADPGVAVYWQRKGEPQKVMAIDLYDRVADNLAAVAATLSAMRAIERHGGAQILERAFTGFDALPAPAAEPHWSECSSAGATPALMKSNAPSARRQRQLIQMPAGRTRRWRGSTRRARRRSREPTS